MMVKKYWFGGWNIVFGWKEMEDERNYFIFIVCLFVGRLTALLQMGGFENRGKYRWEREYWKGCWICKVHCRIPTCNELENEDGNEKDSKPVSKQSINILYQLVALITQQLVIYFMYFTCCLSLVHPTRSKEHNYPWLYVCSWSESDYKYYLIIYCFVFINL